MEAIPTENTEARAEEREILSILKRHYSKQKKRGAMSVLYSKNGGH